MKYKGTIKRVLSVLAILVLTGSLLSCLASAEQASWDCPNCGRKGNTGNFCGNCARPKPKEIKIGDIVTLGRYEQDNNSENGREAIEWIVLDVDKKNKKALLLSRYGLRNKPYHNKFVDVTWEQCTLREWLNDKFLNSVFTAKEQAAILTTAVDNGSSQGHSGWKTNGGNNTRDKIFLLSCTEADRYFGAAVGNSGNAESRVAPTAYAIANGAWANQKEKTVDEKAAGWWWLRSPGRYQDRAAVVYSDGSLSHHEVKQGRGVVRPALWVNLESARLATAAEKEK